MSLRLRTALIALILIIGVTWSLPMHTGRNTAEPGSATYSAADPAQFAIAAHRNALSIFGHTVSAQHEETLRLTVAEHFSGWPLHVEFDPLGVAPDWWGKATTEIVAALATTQSSSARLKEESLHIRAVVANKSATELRLQVLRKVLPESAVFDVELVEIKSTTRAATFCERRFAALDPGQVGFEESGTELRASAYPVLDRIVALADACRDSTVSITGHTDSSGYEPSNEQLSLARARAVADYLGSRGIKAERLNIGGAGSSQPVADNATRYGRGLNRRIDIRFSPGR